MTKSSNETKRAVLSQSIMNETRSSGRLKRINDIIEDYITKEGLKKDNIFCQLYHELCDMIRDIETDIGAYKRESNQIKKEEGKKMTKLTDETRRAVLSQSIMNEAQNRKRLKKINDIIEDYILKEELTKDNIFCRLHKELCDMIEYIESDIVIHKWELQQMDNKENEK